MRIVLIESGGFVGVPLRYEVEVSAVGGATLAALERALQVTAKAPQPPSTSAGGVVIRVEREDGRVRELVLSHSTPAPEITELVQHLRRHAKIIRTR